MRRGRPDDGFTLIELLLSMAILIIIIGAISAALIVFLRNGKEALQRDDHSGGVEVASSYFDRDVASANSVSTAVQTGSNGCQTGTTTNMLVMDWTDYTASAANPSPAPGATTYRAVYRIVTDPDGGFQLIRYSCSNTSLVETSTLIRGLVSAAKATASVAASTACASGSAVTLSIASYSSDTLTPYRFSSCVKTRITP